MNSTSREIPIALISERVPSGVTSLVFENQFGKLTVRGAEGLGLPTAGDNDVIVALMQLTREKNGFTSPVVPFSRYELLKLLGRADKSQHYKRLDESLNRWMGVTLIYEKSWFDNSIKRRVDAKFHILESVVIYDQETRKALRDTQPGLPFSTFSWNRIFFDSCLNGNIKRLGHGGLLQAEECHFQDDVSLFGQAVLYPGVFDLPSQDLRV